MDSQSYVQRLETERAQIQQDFESYVLEQGRCMKRITAEAQQNQTMYESCLKALHAFKDLLMHTNLESSKILCASGHTDAAIDLERKVLDAQRKIDAAFSARFGLFRQKIANISAPPSCPDSRDVRFEHVSLFTRSKQKKATNNEESHDAFGHTERLLALFDGVGAGGHLSGNLSRALCAVFCEHADKEEHLLNSDSGMHILALKTEGHQRVRECVDKKGLGMMPSSTMTAVSVSVRGDQVVMPAVEIGDCQWAVLQIKCGSGGRVSCSVKYISEPNMYPDGRQIPLQISSFHPLSHFFGSCSRKSGSTLKTIPTGIRTGDLCDNHTQYYVLVASDGFWVNFTRGRKETERTCEMLQAKFESLLRGFLHLRSTSFVTDCADFVSHVMMGLEFEIYENCVLRECDDDVTFSVCKISARDAEKTDSKLDQFLERAGDAVFGASAGMAVMNDQDSQTGAKNRQRQHTSWVSPVGSEANGGDKYLDGPKKRQRQQTSPFSCGESDAALETPGVSPLGVWVKGGDKYLDGPKKRQRQQTSPLSCGGSDAALETPGVSPVGVWVKGDEKHVDGHKKRQRRDAPYFLDKDSDKVDGARYSRSVYRESTDDLKFSDAEFEKKTLKVTMSSVSERSSTRSSLSVGTRGNELTDRLSRLDGYRNKLCRFAKSGRCPYGGRCVYAHEDSEVRCKTWTSFGSCTYAGCKKLHCNPRNFEEAKACLVAYDSRFGN